MTAPHPLDPAAAAQWLAHLPGGAACAHVDTFSQAALATLQSDRSPVELATSVRGLIDAGAAGHRGAQAAVETLRRAYLPADSPVSLTDVERWRQTILDAVTAHVDRDPTRTPRCDCDSPATGRTAPPAPTPPRRAPSPPARENSADVIALATQLDQLGVPQRAGRHLARRALTEAGATTANHLLEAALRHRKTQPARDTTPRPADL